MFKRALILFVLLTTAATAQTYTGTGGGVGTHSNQGLTPPTGETVKLLFTFEPDTLTNVDPEFTVAVRNADVIIDLSDPATRFAFVMLDRTLSNTKISSVDGNAWLQSTMKSSASVGDRWKLDSTDRRTELSYTPYTNWIPPGVQITKAIEHRVLAAGSTFSQVDTVSVTLMDAVADSAWHPQVGVTDPSTGITRYAYSTWDFQRSGLGVEGYPATNGPVWTPALDLRTRFWDWGGVTDFSGRPLGAATAQFTEIEFNIINCLQAITNGSVNNGLAYNYSDWGSSVDTYTLVSWESTGAGIPYRPWVEVEYINRPYRSPWPGGKGWAACLQTDDGLYKINKLYADTLRVYGGRFTCYSVAAAPDSAEVSPKYFGWADIVSTWLEGLMEFGSHSINHNPGTGISRYDAMIDNALEYTPGMFPVTLTGSATQWDKLMWDIDSEWIFYGAEQAGFGDLRGARLFGESFGLPVSNHSPDSQIALSRQGYKAVRTLGVVRTLYDNNGNLDWRREASFAPGRADTTYGGFRPADMLGPRNVRFVANTVGLDALVGVTADNPSMATVEYRTRNAIEVARASRRGLLSWLAHDVKTDPDGVYPTGVDPDEFGQITRTMSETAGGPAWMTVTEVGDRFALFSTPIPTPAAFAQPDSFKFTVQDGVWGTLNGANNVFIPGF